MVVQVKADEALMEGEHNERDYEPVGKIRPS